MTTIFDVPGTNPSNPFVPLVQQAFQLPTPEPAKFGELAAQIVETVTTSRDPANSFWSLWDAFFVAIATSTSAQSGGPDSFAAQFALLDALRAHPPTKPNNVAGSDAELRLRTTYLDETDGKIHWSMLPGFNAQWRDMHDILEAWRDWDGIRREKPGASDTADASTTASERQHDPARYFLRFVDFSVALLQERREKDGSTLYIWVFFNCKNVLEREAPQPPQRNRHCLSREQVWALDVRVTATWVRGAGRALWETDQEKLRRHYIAALNEKTDLWPRTDGLTRERWQLWGERLRQLGEEEGKLDEEARAVVREAAEVIEGLLQGK